MMLNWPPVNESWHAGEIKTLNFDGSAETYDFTGHKAKLELRSNTGAVMLMKNMADGISLAANVFSVDFIEADTEGLIGSYPYEFRIFTAADEPVVTVTGTMSFEQAQILDY